MLLNYIIMKPATIHHDAQDGGRGGTFDIIRGGHQALLGAPLQHDSAIIGLCSDEFVHKRGKGTLHDYNTRFYNLEQFICEHFPGKEF